MHLKVIKENLNDLEQNVIENFSHEAENELLLCKQKLLGFLRQEIMACQQSRIKWPKEGDSNTVFFHASLKCKRKNKMIDNMKLEDGRILSSIEEVHMGVVNYFQELLMNSATSMDEEVMSLLNPVISDE